MNVLVHHQYRADRKEQLADMLRRILAAFGQAALVPEIGATFADSADETRVSAVARALKKYPELDEFVSTEPSFPGLPASKRLVGDQATTPMPIDLILAVAGGVPRSLPFDSIQIQFGHPEFDRAGSTGGLAGGVIVGDSWWVNGRNRSMSAMYSVATDAESPDLEPPPAAVADLIAGLGKPRKTSTSVIPDAAGANLTETVEAARELVSRYRNSIGEVVARASLPHELPGLEDVLGAAQPAAGPLKPALVAAFTPRGFDCRGGSGRFTLRRRTEGGSFEMLDLDVGTWSRMITAQYTVHTAAGAVRLHVPVGVGLEGALQYPIGDQAGWEQIVANIAAVVDELGRSFVPDVEKLLGGSPEWFEPTDPLA